MKPNIFKAGIGAVIASGLWLTASCIEDNGNYSYTDLDTVEISSEGLQEEYVVSLGDRLTLAPDVYFNGKKVADGDNVPLDYMWTLYARMTGAGVDYTVDTIGTDRVLDAEMNRAGGTYSLQLTVTNRNNGIESYMVIPCQIENQLTAGWMLLYERADRPGTSDVGLVVNPLVKNNIIRNREYWNLYSVSNGGEPLPGTPVNIVHETMPLPTNGTPRIATSKEVAVVNPNDFTRMYGLDNLFYVRPEYSEIKYFGCCVRMNLMAEQIITDNTVYTLRGATNGTGYFGVPKQADETVGELAAWGTNCINGQSMEAVVYDQTNGRFYYIPTNGVSLTRFNSQTGQWDINDTQGARMLFADWGTNYMDHFIFSRGQEYFLGIANFMMPSLPNIGTTWRDITSSPDIANVSAFAANYGGQFVYYGAGNKVYNLAYNSGQPATLAWTAPTATEKVVSIATQKYYYMVMMMAGMTPNVGQVLHIATWDESKGEGKLYEYKIEPAGGRILADEPSYEYTVPGKVKAMSWKFAMGG